MCRQPEAAATVTRGTIAVNLLQDLDVIDGPRDWDNLGTMCCWHRRYRLGDEQPGQPPNDWWHDLALGLDPALGGKLAYWDEEGFRCLRRKFGADRACARVETIQHKLIWEVLERGVPVRLPLFLLDHSGLAMRTHAFRDCDPGGWDSGQIGWIYTTSDKVEKEYGQVDGETLSRARQALAGEVETYDQYLRGEVYGYIARCQACGQELDSCWGFYGFDFAREEATSIAEYEAAHHICPDWETGV